LNDRLLEELYPTRGFLGSATVWVPDSSGGVGLHYFSSETATSPKDRQAPEKTSADGCKSLGGEEIPRKGPLVLGKERLFKQKIGMKSRVS
jgi:hypothetical protein